MRLGAYFDRAPLSSSSIGSSDNSLIPLTNSITSYFADYLRQQKSAMPQIGRDKDTVVYEIIITPDQGGLEAQDLAQMLHKAYLKYCQKENIKVIKEMSSAHTSLIECRVHKDSTFPMCEHGLHKMTRASPYGNGTIHTSHAKVVCREKTNITVPALKESEITYEPFKSTGPGGQHRNKTMSAIRATHKNGLVTLAANSRHQHENKEQALVQLKEKWEVLFWDYVRSQSQSKWAQRQQMDLLRSYLDNHNYVVWANGNKTRLQDFFKGQIDFSQ